MPRNSLSLRLIGSAAVVSIVLLIAAGLLLNALFAGAMERNFDQRLQDELNELLANAEIDKSGHVAVVNYNIDVKFNRPLQGWYWQVTKLSNGKLTAEEVARSLASPSLLEQRLPAKSAENYPRDASGVARYYLTDINRTRLRVIEQRVTLFGKEQKYSFLVAGNFDVLRAEIERFNGLLFGILALLGAGLIGAIIAQVRFGLLPIRQIQEEIIKVRQGKIENLQETYPTELEPVARELNGLLRSNTEVIERARTQVGNLAHALKTPLSVLSNEARLSKSKLAIKVEEQTHVMRDQLSLYLDRARRAASAQTIGAVTDVAPIGEALARTLMRIHHDNNLKISCHNLSGLKFRGEKQDLEEMLGNLMDNASKWAKGRVQVVAELIDNDGKQNISMMRLYVEDDGPGLPPEKFSEAMKRGHRLDETKPGTGLGLSIVAEIAAMYGGNLSLDTSDLGGLKTIISLPMVAISKEKK